MLVKLKTFIYQAVLETVARVKSKKNETKEEKYVLVSFWWKISPFISFDVVVMISENSESCLVWTSHSVLNFFRPYDRSFQFHNVFNLDNENRAEDMPTLIDRKVCVPHVILDGYRVLIFYGSWRTHTPSSPLPPHQKKKKHPSVTKGWSLFSFDLLETFLQDNVFIISNPKSKYPVLQLDLRLAFTFGLIICYSLSASFLSDLTF